METPTSTEPPTIAYPFEPNATIQRLQTILIVYIMCPVTALGSIANIINIIIFSRLNKRQTINISLLALAVSDLLQLLGALWSTICYNPLMLASEDVPFMPEELHLITGTAMHSIFSMTTANLTLLISTERCLCVLRPMKVKTFITPQRIKAIIVALFIWGVGSHCLLFYTNQVVLKFSPYRNRTLYGLLQTKDWRELEIPNTIILNILAGYVLPIGILTTTIVLIVKLRQQVSWRKATVGQTSTSDTLVRRAFRVAKTVCIVSGVYIICYLPGTANLMAMFSMADYNFQQKYHELHTLITAFTFFCQNVNSSVNIVIYWIFSSQYREGFKTLFGCCYKSRNQG